MKAPLSQDNIPNLKKQNTNMDHPQQQRYQNHQQHGQGSRPPGVGGQKQRTTSNSSQGGYPPNPQQYQQQPQAFQQNMAYQNQAGFVGQYPAPNYGAPQNMGPPQIPVFYVPNPGGYPNQYQQIPNMPPQRMQNTNMVQQQPNYTGQQIPPQLFPQVFVHQQPQAFYPGGPSYNPQQGNPVQLNAPQIPAQSGVPAVVATAAVDHVDSAGIIPTTIPSASQQQLPQRQLQPTQITMYTPETQPKQTPPEAPRKKNILVFVDPNTKAEVVLPGAGETKTAAVTRPAVAPTPSVPREDSSSRQVSESDSTSGAVKENQECTAAEAEKIRADFSRAIHARANVNHSSPKETSTTSSRASPVVVVPAEGSVYNGAVRKVSIQEPGGNEPVDSEKKETVPSRPTPDRESSIQMSPPSHESAPLPERTVITPQMNREQQHVVQSPELSPSTATPTVVSQVPSEPVAAPQVASEPEKSSNEDDHPLEFSAKTADDVDENGGIQTSDNEDADGADPPEKSAAMPAAGRKVYSREALCAIEMEAKNMQLRPDTLLNIRDIIKKDIAQQNRPPQQQQQQGGRMSDQYGRGATGKYGPSPPQPQVIKLHLSQDEYVPPPSSENAWKPSAKKQKAPIAPDDEVAQTEEVLATIRALLNKLTPNNYEKLSKKMLEIPFTTTSERLTGTVDLIFEKALEELNYAEIYARLCRTLITVETTDIEGRPVKVRTVLLQRAQRYFEKTDQESEAAAADDKDIEPEVLAEKRAKAKRHYLGNIRFISELYKYEMLTDKVILSCFQRLLPKKQDFSDADEEKLECLCKLLMTCAQRVKAPDTEKAQIFFDMLKKMIDAKVTSSRIRFLMQDAIDLKNNNFVARKNVAPANVKPKTIEEIHAEKRKEEQDIKQAVLEASYTPGQRNQPPPMRGGMQGAQGRNLLQPGGLGMSKTRSVPGNMAQMGGKAGPTGRSGLPGLETTTANRPSKFLSAIGGAPSAEGGHVPTLGPGGKSWASGSGSFNRPSHSGGMTFTRSTLENKSASSSRESSTSRMENARDGPRKSLTLTPNMRDTGLLGREGAGTPILTPMATPIARSPVQDEVEVDSDTLEKEVNHMIAGVTKSEDAELADVINDAVKTLSGWAQTSRGDFVKKILEKYFDAKKDDRSKMSSLWMGVVQANILSQDTLVESLGSMMEATGDIAVDVPNIYDYMVELIGPLAVESVLPLDLVHEDIFKKSGEYLNKYQNAFKKWINTDDHVPPEKREDLLSKDPSRWKEIFSYAGQVSQS